MPKQKKLHPLHRAYLKHRKKVAPYVGGENLFELKVVVILVALYLLYRFVFHL